MKIELTKKQYEILMKLVYIGNWIVNGFKTEDLDEDSDALENHIFSKAGDFGLGKFVFFDEDLDGWYPTAAAEDKWQIDLDDFRNDSFWDELEFRLADRDLVVRYGEKKVENMSLEERNRLERELVDHYYGEFIKNGLKNLVLLRPQ